MILVDTSLWIEWLKGRSLPLKEDLLETVVTCSPVVQEVLQGLKHSPQSKEFQNSFLNFPVVLDPLPLKIYIQAAELFRLGRSRGHTVRSSIDCLIAAIAIEVGIPVAHKDRDYEVIRKFSPLEVVRL